MDNDIKVENSKNGENTSSQRHKEVLLFLNEELNNIQHEQESSAYNLEQEYAETKKHKSPFIPLTILGCILLVGLSSVILTSYIKHRDEKIVVNLEEFNSLNLKNLLDSVSKVQTNYDEAVRNKIRIENKMESALKSAEETHINDLYLIDSLNLRSKKQIEERKSAADKKYEERVEEIKAEYQDQLIEAEKHVIEFSNQLNAYDASKVEAAREQEKAVDGERQVQEMEKKRLINQYESRIAELEQTISRERRENAETMRKALKEVADKYQAEIDLLDPVLKDAKADKVIGEYKEIPEINFNGTSLIQNNSINDTTIENGFDNFQKAYDKYKYIRQPIVKIPHKNTVPEYVSTSNKLVNDMGNTFAQTSVALHEEKVQLSQEITQLKDQITQMQLQHENEVSELKNNFAQENKSLRSSYEASLENLLTAVKSNAVVISAEASDKISIYVTAKARYLINEDTVVEIKGTKAVRGLLVQSETAGYYNLIPALDKEGNEIEIDSSLIAAGNSVKILAK